MCRFLFCSEIACMPRFSAPNGPAGTESVNFQNESREERTFNCFGGLRRDRRLLLSAMSGEAQVTRLHHSGGQRRNAQAVGSRKIRPEPNIVGLLVHIEG